jgi:hypothetical protein
VDFIAQALTAGSLVTSANDRLLGNLFAYAGKYAPISVTDALPAGFSFVSATGSGWTCSAAGQTATCKYPGSLAVGASTSITLTGAVAAGATGSLLNTARVSLLNDGNPYNDGAQDTAAISSRPAVPSVNSSLPRSARPAAPVTITGRIWAAPRRSSSAAHRHRPHHREREHDHRRHAASSVAGLVNVTLNAAGPTSATLTNAFLYVASTGGLGFYTLNPCRVIDTRDPAGTFGGPALAAGGSRTFAIRGQCSIPMDAAGVVANVTTTNASSPGNLKINPAGIVSGQATAIEFAGATRANNAFVGLNGSPAGSMKIEAVMPTGSVDVIFDVVGYFK